MLVTRLHSEITPVTADHVADGLEQARQGRYAAYVIELDTPGGLAQSMRAIVEDILASPVPVIVYVSPEGARAASAGASITLASHVAVMAPGTAIGAATPVGGGGENLRTKVINDAAAQAESLARLRGRNTGLAVAMVRQGRSFGVDEALSENLVDLRAASLDEALRAADGRQVRLAGGRTARVATAGATVERHDIGLFRQILHALANPNLGFLFLTVGLLGLIFELSSPGAGVGGVVGVVALSLGAVSLAILPINVLGILLLVVAAGLFVAELFAPGIGGFAVTGAITLALGAFFLFDETEGVQVDPVAVLPTAVVMAVLAVLVGRYARQSWRGGRARSGTEALIGQVVELRDVRDDHARAFLEGAWWSARITGPPPPEGADARVVGLDGLTLLVEPLAEGDKS